MDHRHSQLILCMLVAASGILRAEAAEVQRFKAGQRLTLGDSGVQVAPSNPVTRGTVGKKLEYKASPQLQHEREAEYERLDGLIEERRASGHSGVAPTGELRRPANPSLAPMPKKSNVRMRSSYETPEPMRGSESAGGRGRMKPTRD